MVGHINLRLHSIAVNLLIEVAIENGHLLYVYTCIGSNFPTKLENGNKRRIDFQKIKNRSP